MVRRSPPQPVLITDAAASRIEEHNARRRRYALTMGLRLVCLIMAAVLYHIVWAMAILIVAACVLPWMAVLIANDRPPKKAQRVNRYAVSDERAISSGIDPNRIIDV